MADAKAKTINLLLTFHDEECIIYICKNNIESEVLHYEKLQNNHI